MKNRNPQLFFHDILESIEKIIKYTKPVSYEDFVLNDIIIDAVMRNFEIIGEAAKHIPDEFKEKYSQLPIKEMIGMRNILIHNYLGVDYEFVWQTIQEDLPVAKKIIKEIIEENF